MSQNQPQINPRTQTNQQKEEGEVYFIFLFGFALFIHLFLSQNPNLDTHSHSSQLVDHTLSLLWKFSQITYKKFKDLSSSKIQSPPLFLSLLLFLFFVQSKGKYFQKINIYIKTLFTCHLIYFGVLVISYINLEVKFKGNIILCMWNLSQSPISCKNL